MTCRSSLRLAASAAVLLTAAMLQACLTGSDEGGGARPDYTGAWREARAIYQYNEDGTEVHDTVSVASGVFYDWRFLEFRHDSIFFHSYEDFPYVGGPEVYSAVRVDAERWKLVGSYQNVRFTLSGDGVLKMVLTSSPEGSYRIEFTRHSGSMPPPEWGTTHGGLDEPNDSYSQAIPIAVNAAPYLAWLATDDVDWYSFQAQAGTTYTIGTHSELDPALSLYSTNGTTFLDDDDDSGEGADALITWTAPSTGTYFFRARLFLADYEGSYTVDVRTVTLARTDKERTE